MSIERAVLIIDDERRMTESLRNLFGKAGYRVETANAGAEGIEAMARHPFPVVVTDLRMQGVDGMQVIRHIHDHYPKSLVIAITGYASTESAIEALHYRAFDYIRKPFEFEHLKAAVDRAFHKLEVDQLREDTAAMITHDIKVPLTSILGFASMIFEDGKLHPRAREFAETIQTNAQKILSLVDNYLTSCKIESDSLVVNPVPVRIREMIQDLRETVELEAGRHGFAIEIDPFPEPESANFDEHYVYRAVGNLLQNAVKYGDPTEPIRINVNRLPADASPIGRDAVEFEVVNFAPDVEPENLKGLFGRFKRAADNAGIEGSGIGLYIVDHVARGHGGLARAECREGGRVAFSIVLPLEPIPAEQPAAEAP